MLPNPKEEKERVARGRQLSPHQPCYATTNTATIGLTKDALHCGVGCAGASPQFTCRKTSTTKLSSLATGNTLELDIFSCFKISRNGSILPDPCPSSCVETTCAKKCRTQNPRKKRTHLQLLHISFKITVTFLEKSQLIATMNGTIQKLCPKKLS